MGKLFQLLKDLNLDQDTLVIFTSDNGPHNEGAHQHEFFDSNGPLKGHKRSMHDGGIRVPLIARWPGKIKAGSVTNHPSAFWDFLPTACAVAGAQTPQGIDGISYLPTLLGKDSQQQKHEYLYWTSREGETSVGLRYQNWKLVKYRKKKSDPTSSHDWRLYDLSNDLGEEQNLAASHPDLVKKIQNLVLKDGFALSPQPRR